jgi:hypothetical protein
MANQLGVGLAVAKQLLESARDSLPEELRHELSQPADTSQYGLGAIPPFADETE